MQNEWSQTAAFPQLGPNELQLWRVDLDDTGPALTKTFLNQLSSDELERANRFKASQVRMQFISARACLRVLLGFHLNVAPKDVRIVLTSYGKPQTPSIDGRNLFFNVAHSRSMIIIGLCRDSPIGVDIEYLDRMTDVIEIASKTFTQQEFRAIECQPNADRRRKAFFNCWTRKEAIIKADGRGLSMPLTSFDVPVAGPVDRTPVCVSEEGLENVVYFLSDLKLNEEIAGSLALTMPQYRTARFVFPLANF